MRIATLAGRPALLDKLRTEAADPAAAAALVPTVREAYARLTASGATAGA
ncbi:hypothetical protein ABZ114_17685 [Streptomyces albidoflavus]|nr:hypothetical protein [Streptomyces sp. KE1]